MDLEVKKLNLGSGTRPKKGYVNIDWSELGNPEVIHDLNVFPYPFADSTFDEIEMQHVIEHLDKVFDVMREAHRLLKPGGVVHIQVPHFSRGFTHSEHVHGFDITFPYYFNKKLNFSGYYGFEFKERNTKLRWLAHPHLMKEIGYGNVTISILMGISAVISWFANLSPAFASRIWCFWVGGFEEIEFYLEAKK